MPTDFHAPDADLAALLRCPVTGRSLVEATNATTDRVRDAAATLRHADGSAVPREIERVFADTERERLYVQATGIARLLPDNAIPTTALAGSPLDLREREGVASTPEPSADKVGVQRFYDDAGWKKVEGRYLDAKLFASDNLPAQRYKFRCTQRVTARLGRGGFLLDAASGPVPQGAATSYAQGFEHHVCVDLSLTALQEARANLGPRGIYLLGDLTRLPLRDGVMDAAASLYTIFHIPKDEQANAFRELHRVVQPGRRAVAVYCWGRHALLPNLLTLHVQLARYVHKRLLPKTRDGQPTLRSLYFHAHSPAWFDAQDWPFDYEVTCFRFANNQLLQLYIHERFGGQTLVDALGNLEERYAHELGRLGYYPLITIHKAADSSR